MREKRWGEEAGPEHKRGETKCLLVTPKVVGGLRQHSPNPLTNVVPGGMRKAAGGKWQAACGRRQAAGSRLQAAGGKWQAAGR